MGLFDDAMKNAVPGGSVSKPLMIALGALLLGKMLHHGSSASAPAAAPDGQQPSVPTPPAGGDIAGGLGALIDKLKNGGLGDIVGSWIQPGQNTPVPPGQLGSALGQKTVSEIAQQAGMTEQELLAQLSRVLPGVVDKLTPDGRLPAQGSS